MGVYGPVALALMTVARAMALAVIAGDFADRSSQTLGGRGGALQDPALLIPRYMGISAALGLAFWLVKGSLDAMRVGLFALASWACSGSHSAPPSCFGSAR